MNGSNQNAARAGAEQVDLAKSVSSSLASPKQDHQNANLALASETTATGEELTTVVPEKPTTAPADLPEATPGEAESGVEIAIAVPEPSATCLNPQDHCLPKDLLFASLEPWGGGRMRIALVKQTTKADRAGEASFRTIKGDRSLVTGSFYRSHRARRNEILLGSMAIYYRGNQVNQIFRAPASRAAATSTYWSLARIVSTAGIASGGYVLLSGGERVDLAALRVVEGDGSQTAKVTGAVDAHFLRDVHWVRTGEPYRDDQVQRAWVAVALQEPGLATQGEGHFLSTASGKEYWTAHASHTRVAHKKDIKLGVRVFALRESLDKVYRKPKSRTQALSSEWFTGLITDPSKAFKGQVQVGNERMVSVDALRVIID